MKRAVLVMAYGGPDSLDDVEPYLLDIRGGRPTSPELVHEIRERYALIGGRSPLLEITCAQAGILEKFLNELSDKDIYRVYVGMRHWKPYIRDAVAQIARDGIQDGIAICMAPHASRMSTGAYLQKLREAETSINGSLGMGFIESWYDQPFLIEALAQKVREAVGKFNIEDQGSIHYMFTAHSLPASLSEQSDPYVEQLNATSQLLAEVLGLSQEQWSFAFQSAGSTSIPWLGPDINDALQNIAKDGNNNILLTPIGFMADHVEVLFDIDIEAQKTAHSHGINLVRSESLNADSGFIEGLAKFILGRAEKGNGA